MGMRPIGDIPAGNELSPSVVYAWEPWLQVSFHCCCPESPMAAYRTQFDFGYILKSVGGSDHLIICSVKKCSRFCVNEL